MLSAGSLSCGGPAGIPGFRAVELSRVEGVSVPENSSFLSLGEKPLKEKHFFLQIHKVFRDRK